MSIRTAGSVVVLTVINTAYMVLLHALTMAGETVDHEAAAYILMALFLPVVAANVFLTMVVTDSAPASAPPPPVA